MSLAEKLKMDDVEDLFIKYNVPVEIIEKIIGFVPSKKNCFLVSKTFHRESINATRNKSILIMDHRTIISESFMNVQWAFNEIVWSCRSERFFNDPETFFALSKNFFKKFGPRVEKLSIIDILRSIDLSYFLEVLKLLPNLVELQLMIYWSIHKDQNPNGIVELAKLKKLSIVTSCSYSGLLDNISCPLVQTLDYRTTDASALKFFRRHNRWKEIVNYGLICQALLDNEQSFEHLCQLELTTLELPAIIESSKFAALIERQPRLTSLKLYLWKNTQEEMLRRVVKLQHLESFEICLHSDIHIPDQLVHDIVQMPKLKTLCVLISSDIVNLVFFKTVLQGKNQQLETLKISELNTNNLTEGLHQIANNFPNLKVLETYKFKGNLNFFLQMRKLKSLKIDRRIDELDIDESEELRSNEAVRELVAGVPPLVLEKIIRMTPNIETLKILNCKGQQDPNDYITNVFNEVFGLQNLIEIECDWSRVICHKEVSNRILNRSGRSKLQRITCYREASAQMVAVYGKQFPFKRVDIKTNKVSMSRY